MEDEKAGLLVEFPKEPDAVKISIAQFRPRKPATCRHYHVELHEEGEVTFGSVQRHRSITCAKCGEVLDPFEVLWRYAATDDKLKRQQAAWKGLEEAWAWLWENGATLAISRSGGVKSSVAINGKRRSRKASACQRDGLAALIIGAIEALKMMKKWEKI